MKRFITEIVIDPRAATPLAHSRRYPGEPGRDKDGKLCGVRHDLKQHAAVLSGMEALEELAGPRDQFSMRAVWEPETSTCYTEIGIMRATQEQAQERKGNT